MPSDKLFQLIKSLSVPEKRYFKRVAGGRGTVEENNYLRLFDCISGMDDYDEKYIHEAFHGEKLLSNLAPLKVKLYKLVLKIMREQESQKTIRRQIGEMLEDAHFLMGKGLAEQSREILEDVAEIARKYEESSALMEILNLHRRTLYANPRNIEYDKVEEILREKADILLTITQQRSLENIFDRLFLMFCHNTSPDDSTAAYAETLLHEAEAAAQEVRSFKCMNTLLNIRSICQRLRGNPEAALKYTEAIIELWSAYPHFIRQDMTGYTRMISNLAGLYLRAGNMAGVRDLLIVLDRLEVRTTADTILKFQIQTHLWLLYLMNTGDFAAVLPMLPEIERRLAEYRQALNPVRLLTFHYNLLVTYFMTGDIDQAFRHSRSIIEKRKLNIRHDIIIFAHIMAVLIQHRRCEISGRQSDLDFLDSLHTSTRRYLKKFNTRYLRELQLLDLVTKQEEPDKWQKLKTLVEGAPGMIGHEELSIMLGSRLSGKTMPDIFQQRLRSAHETD